MALQLQYYESQHIALGYADGVPNTHADDPGYGTAAGYTKHAPTLTYNEGEVNIRVRHPSDEDHFIEAVWAEDENGMICGYCEYQQPGPDDTIEETVCSFNFAGKECTGVTFTPYEFCNLHGIWKGQETNMEDWLAYTSFMQQHNAFGTYVQDTPSSFDTDRTPLAKHTPVVAMSNGVATVTVNHPSSDTHWIESVFLFDQNGEIYMQNFAAQSEDDGIDATVAEFTLPDHVTSFTPYESCNLHGIWMGQTTSHDGLCLDNCGDVCLSDPSVCNECLGDHPAIDECETANPTSYPTNDPTFEPTANPTPQPTAVPTVPFSSSNKLLPSAVAAVCVVVLTLFNL
jgi:desulfoferrodoxin (superoxide reductase-like protein)